MHFFAVDISIDEFEPTLQPAGMPMRWEIEVVEN